MTVHLLRDYLTQNTTTGNRTWISTYLVTIFLRRVLGYTYVGDTIYNMNSVGQWLFATGDTTPTAATPTFPVGNKAGITNNGSAIEVSIPISVRGVVASDVGRILFLKSPLYPTRNSGAFLITALQQGNTTTIAALSNNVALPTGTINVVSTTGFPTSGTFFVGPNTTETAPLSTTIAAASNGLNLPQGTINVASTTGFPTSGTIIVGTGLTNIQSVVTYTNTNSTQFLGCTGGTGTLLTGGLIHSGTTINVASTTGFTTTGSLHMLTVGGVQTITYTGTTGTTFTGCTGLQNYLFAGGTVFSSNDIQTITYTNTNSTQFLGCTGGTGTLITGESVYNQNKYVIDYRGNGDLSLTEAVDTVPWYLYDKDINCPTLGANNTSSSSQYRGNGNSTTNRIILQSPHATGWQVRICNETNTDSLSNFTCAMMTFAPGFGGDGYGDFATGANGGRHLHGGLYNDTSDSNFNTGIGCGDNAGTGPQYRFTMIGDDTGQSISIFARRPGNATNPTAFYVSFGLPDNEPSPLPIQNVCRLYCLGNAASNNLGTTRLSDIALQTADWVSSGLQGAAFSLFNFGPKSCSPSLLAYVTGNNQFAGPAFDAQASDNPFSSATELLPIDLVTGVTHNWTNNAGQPVRLPFEPRAIGTLAFIRQGRTNFGDFVLSTDTGSWSVSTTTGNAVSPIQVTTSTTNNLVTGQTVAINGVTGNTAANGTFTVTVISNTQFTLDGTTGNGSYISGGTVLRGASFQHMRRGIYMMWNGPAVPP